MTRRPPGLLALVLLVSGCGPRSDRVPLIPDLGSHHVTISSRNPQAQAYFDQGVRLSYGFNHGEAIRAFREAKRLDPDCAICAWGEALAYGPNINLPMDSAAARAAWRAIGEARRLSSRASERERDLIDALAQRYSADAGTPQAPRDSAYARAMRALLDRYPDDREIATLYAESVMNLSPWDYWDAEGNPRDEMAEALSRLERVIAADSAHPGACHFYIHAVEAVHPDRAVACAERLASAMPGAGHLVHMPAHIYVRVGRYADAVQANIHATHADSSYLRIDRRAGFYDVGYVPHNHHFLAFAASLAGMRAVTIDAAREAARKTGIEGARLALETEYVLPGPQLYMTTFGMWDSVLAEPMPPADLPVARGLAVYARGAALAATGRIRDSRAELESLRAMAVGTPEGTRRQLLLLAAHALCGEIAWREGLWDEAESQLRAAAAIEDALPYMEPPYWHHPVRHALGAALLAAGRPLEAEQAYRAALARFPENGWALAGLRRSLAAQGRAAEAAAVAERLAAAWKSADVPAPGGP